jgi:biotin transport system substrate-specific component
MLAALLIPMLVGAKYGFGALALYLALGLAGLPVFAGGGGLAYVVRPSFGFLVGFAVGAIPCGIISRIRESFWAYLLGGLVALVVIEFIGGLYFWWIMNFIQDKPLTLVNSVFISVLPFVPMDLIKLVLAALIAVRLRKFIRISNATSKSIT